MAINSISSVTATLLTQTAFPNQNVTLSSATKGSSATAKAATPNINELRTQTQISQFNAAGQALFPNPPAVPPLNNIPFVPTTPNIGTVLQTRINQPSATPAQNSLLTLPKQDGDANDTVPLFSGQIPKPDGDGNADDINSVGIGFTAASQNAGLSSYKSLNTGNESGLGVNKVA